MSKRIALGALALALFGCSAGNPSTGDGTQNGENATGGGTGTGFTPGCSVAPECGSCGTCSESCYCVKQDIGYCSNYCTMQSAGSGGAPSAGGSTGITPSSGGSPVTGGGGSPVTSSGGAPVTGSGGSPVISSGGTTAAGGTSAGTGGATGLTPPPAGTNEFDITTSTFQVPAGGEVYECQNFHNPNTQDLAILESDSFMSPGSHHMFVFNDPSFDTDTGQVASCSGTEFHPYLHAAQTPQVQITYPEGVGHSLKSTEGLRILAHYLNSTSGTLNAQVEVKFYTVPASQVQFLAAEMFLNNGTVVVPPGMSTQSRTFSVPYDIKMLNAVSHMHKRGVNFHCTTSSGQLIYDGDQWDEPVATVFNPAMDIAAGSVITWACTYNNTGTTTYTFGESALTNEMCILNAVFYPSAPGSTQGQPLNTVF